MDAGNKGWCIRLIMNNEIKGKNLNIMCQTLSMPIELTNQARPHTRKQKINTFSSGSSLVALLLVFFAA